MWLITWDQIDESGRSEEPVATRWLRPGKSYILGRTQCDIAFPRDKSVSRQQARLAIATAPSVTTTGQLLDLASTPLHVTDSKSRFGTFVNGQRLAANQANLVRSGDVLTFGAQTTRLQLTWQPLVLCFSGSSSKQQAMLADRAIRVLDARFATHWNDRCTHMVVGDELGGERSEELPIIMDPNVGMALMRGGQVVNQTWLTDLTGPGLDTNRGGAGPDTEEPYRSRLEALEARFELPSAAAHLPYRLVSQVISQRHGNPGHTAVVTALTRFLQTPEPWQPHPDRTTLFANWSFIAMTDRQFDRLQTTVEAGDGVVINLSPEEYPSLLADGPADSPGLNLEALEELLTDYEQEYPGRSWCLMIDPFCGTSGQAMASVGLNSAQAASCSAAERALWGSSLLPDSQLRAFLDRIYVCLATEASVFFSIVMANTDALGDSLDAAATVLATRPGFEEALSAVKDRRKERVDEAEAMPTLSPPLPLPKSPAAPQPDERPISPPVTIPSATDRTRVAKHPALVPREPILLPNVQSVESVPYASDAIGQQPIRSSITTACTFNPPATGLETAPSTPANYKRFKKTRHIYELEPYPDF
ncbi:hypothetical protein IWQ60_008348 [Tieghemiomyces parasiticus]|uniref:FHA domain-containing protein n=1 Tax=Tieghemiomyces parasiticus TaxID=78921 RepID=A0A9W7ZSJ2_9FUNG|nr:hypothetical protein IWQ60_008348 [Tieghemiomyces parasiticus]